MNASMPRQEPPAPIPLTIVTGFLGAGKTTLLNRLLAEPEMAGTLTIVNEFGDVGLDHLLLDTTPDNRRLLAAGCLCCTVRGDLVGALEQLLRDMDNGRMAPLRRVIIETTGLADPAPVLQVTMGHPYLGLRFRLEGVVTVVDAMNGLATIAAHEEASKQVAVADRLVLSKSDLLPAGEAAAGEALRARLAALNPSAPVILTDDVISAQELLDCGLYDPASKLPDVARWLRAEEAGQPHGHHHAHDGGHGHDHHHGHDHQHGHGAHRHDVNRHGDDIRSFALEDERPVTPAGLANFLDLLRHGQGAKLLRLKGIVALDDDPARPAIIHCVQHVMHPVTRLSRWPDANHATRMVCIVKGLDPSFVNRLWSSLHPD